jgi:hypothetical protein
MEGGKSKLSLHHTPGLESFYDPSSAKEVRGLHAVEDKLFAVIGNKLYHVDRDGTGTAITGTLTKDAGVVWMADNGLELMVLEPGETAWICDLTHYNTITEVTDTNFPKAIALEFLDGYFCVVEKDTFNLYISAQYDGSSWSSTDYATAEKQMDNLKSLIVHGGQLVLLGEKNTEVWYNSGATTFPLEVIASVDIGIYAPDSVAKDQDSIYFLDNRLRVVKSVGYAPKVISTPQVEYQIQKYSESKNAIGYCYEQEGHSFYVLSFPKEATTWVYDTKLEFWHERQSYMTLMSGVNGRHRSNCHARFEEKHIVGDYQNGKLYQMKLDVYADDGNTIKRQRTAQVIEQDGKNIFFNSLEIDMETGVGLVTGQGSDPQVMLDWSDDSGRTWGNELQASIGKMGEYDTRVRFRKLGRSRNRIFRLTISDPIPVHIIKAYLDARRGDA